VTYGSHSARHGQGDFIRNSLDKKPSIGYNIYLTKFRKQNTEHRKQKVVLSPAEGTGVLSRWPDEKMGNMRNHINKFAKSAKSVVYDKKRAIIFTKLCKTKPICEKAR